MTKQEPKGKVWIRCATKGEFDCAWDVYLQDPDDLPGGWIDVIYSAFDDTEHGEQECRDWAERNGYEVIPDPEAEELAHRQQTWGTTRLIVIYITPEEEAKGVVFDGFPIGADPEDYIAQIERFIGERSCSLPYLMMVWPNSELPAICSSADGWLDFREIQLA